MVMTIPTKSVVPASMSSDESGLRNRELLAFNRSIDWDHEAKLGTVFFGVEKSREFPPLDIRSIRQLANAGFLDLEASHNDAPAAGELLSFAREVVDQYREYQFEVGFIGYMVSPDRADSRIRLEGLSIRSPGPIPDQLKVTVARRFDPDILTVDDFVIELKWD
jgi:hypothetical protein